MMGKSTWSETEESGFESRTCALESGKLLNLLRKNPKVNIFVAWETPKTIGLLVKAIDKPKRDTVNANGESFCLHGKTQL